MFLDDVYDYLIAQGVVSTGWSLHVGYFTDDADQTIGIFPTGGLPQDTLGRENLRPTFQTRIRASKLDFATAYAKWQDVFNALQDAKDTPGSPHLLPGVAYVQAMAGAPLCFNDDKERPNMTSNWRVLVAR